jgi:hypothetical protein
MTRDPQEAAAAELDHGSVGIIDHAMQSMAIWGSSRTIARAGRIRTDSDRAKLSGRTR